MVVLRAKTSLPFKLAQSACVCVAGASATRGIHLDRVALLQNFFFEIVGCSVSKSLKKNRG